MDERVSNLHRTWAELMIAGGQADLATWVAQIRIEILTSNFNECGFTIEIPPAIWLKVNSDEELLNKLKNGLKMVGAGHLFDQNGGPISFDDCMVEHRIMLVEATENWQDDILGNSDSGPSLPAITS